MVDEKYQAYLASREWALKRNAVMKRCAGRCERCNWNEAYHVHHLTYARKYEESLEDLRALCIGCHEFTHGKSDLDPALSSPTMLRDSHEPVRCVYLVGTCGPNNLEGDEGNWRREITSAYYRGHKDYRDNEVVKNAITLVNGKTLDYSGPFIQYDHGCMSSHRYEQTETLRRAVEGIRAADLIFAWIDCLDCFGSFSEIGYAVGMYKPVVIAGPKKYDDLWFVYKMGQKFDYSPLISDDPLAAFRSIFVDTGEP